MARPILYLLALACVFVVQAAHAGPFVSGGGNSINGHLIEEYQVDIQKLPAFKDFVRPMVEKIADRAGDPGFSPCKFYYSNLLTGALLTAAVQKTWYLVPAKLEELPASTTGLGFESYQSALQTDDAIWIDKTSFDQMSPTSQGLLLLHEIAMTVEMRRYFPRMFKDLTDSERSRIHAEVRLFTLGIPQVLESQTQDQLEDFLSQFQLLPTCQQ